MAYALNTNVIALTIKHINIAILTEDPSHCNNFGTDDIHVWKKRNKEMWYKYSA